MGGMGELYHPECTHGPSYPTHYTASLESPLSDREKALRKVKTVTTTAKPKQAEPDVYLFSYEGELPEPWRLTMLTKTEWAVKQIESQPFF